MIPASTNPDLSLNNAEKTIYSKVATPNATPKASTYIRQTIYQRYTFHKIPERLKHMLIVALEIHLQSFLVSGIERLVTGTRPVPKYQGRVGLQLELGAVVLGAEILII